MGDGLDRTDLPELHYIAPIANVPSILERGILSNQGARSIPHQSVAKQEVQDIRAKVQIPGGMKLHAYANLYIDARNPMMSLRRGQHTQLCVVRISTDPLEIPGTIISDQNAASEYARYAPSPNGLRIINKELAFAEDWRSNNLIDYWQRKSARCAEVLVPQVVPPQCIIGFYVSCDASKAQVDTMIRSVNAGVPVDVNPRLFFLG